MSIYEQGELVIVPWLANQIFSAFPQAVTGLKFYILDCGCIYYQRAYRDSNLDSQIGIYRDAEDGPCEICVVQDECWKGRVIDEVVVCSCCLSLAFHDRNL